MDLSDGKHLALRSGLDLSDLSNEQRTQLTVCVAQMRLSLQRIGNEMLLMSQHLSTMNEILGSRFNRFVAEELGLSEKTSRRLLHAHTVLKSKFSDEDGRINGAFATHLTQNALQLLGPDTDDTVIAEIRERVVDGERLGAAEVREIIASREKDLELQLQAAQAEVDSVSKKAAKAAEQSELEIARIRSQVDGLNEHNRRLQEQNQAMEEEVDRLQSQSIQVNEKEVEVPPKGYTSVQEAIESANNELKAAQERKQQVEAELASSQQKLVEFNTRIADSQAGMDHFIRLKEQIDAIALQFPPALVRKISADENIKAAINTLADAMVAMGNQLKVA